MGSNKNPRQVVDGMLKCNSKYHEGDRLVPLSAFPKKVTSPDGYDYTCKSCHSAYNKQHFKPQYARWKSAHPVRAMLTGRRADAKKRGIEFTLVEKDVIIPDVCPVLGIPIIHNTGGSSRSDNSPSLDRIDNNKGYIPGNVVVVSWRANLLKKDASIDEIIKLAKFYTKYKEQEDE